jgi:hypothetical protein
MRDISQDQENREIARRRTTSTSHKKSRRLTLRLRKRTISGWKQAKLSGPRHGSATFGALYLKTWSPPFMRHFCPTIGADTISPRTQTTAASHSSSSAGWRLAPSSASHSLSPLLHNIHPLSWYRASGPKLISLQAEFNTKGTSFLAGRFSDDQPSLTYINHKLHLPCQALLR